MAQLDDFKAFTQSVYLVIKGRYFDDIDSDDGTTLILQTADWLNQYLDELELELDSNGEPVDWKWNRTNGVTLGTAKEDASSVTFDTKTFMNLITEENRYVQVVQDGTVVSNFAVVSPDEISNQTDRVTEDMCTLVNDQLIFSRTFHDYEDGGTIIGDVTEPTPRVVMNQDGTTLTANNIKALSVVKPKQLLVLGVAKNASLPDIVQGGLSPSYTQKYGDLLKNAIARNSVGSIGSTVQRDNLSSIGGIY